MVKEVLNTYGQMIVKKLQDDIKNKPIPRKNGKSYPLNASGRLAKSIRYVVEDNTLKVYADSYIYYLVYGRGPTKADGNGELLPIIRKWIDVKGITPNDGISKDSLAFLITRSIHKNGTLLYPQGSTLISDIVNEKMINDLKSDIFIQVVDEAVSAFHTLKKVA
jgi:hypothetical protein